MFDGILTFLVGLWATLIATGKVAISKDPVANAQHLQKFGSLYRVLGPIAMIAGAILAVAALARG